MSKQKLVSFFSEKNFMVTPDFLKKVPDDFDYDIFVNKNNNLQKNGSTVLLTSEMFENFFSYDKKVEDCYVTKVEVLDPYVDKPKKREVKDFVSYMKIRYNSLKKILLQRIELNNTISINKVLSKKAKESVSLIGFVYSNNKTKNGNYILELEDPTGIIKVLIPARSEELIPIMDEVVLDEVIGITGVVAENMVYAKGIIFPDIPVKDFKKSRDDVSVAFIADMHVGSKLFMADEFERFIDWINLKGNAEQIEEAKKVKYLVISGDLIDGIGIYPGQEKELEIKDIYLQYEKVAEYLSQIRKDVKIIVCGGNHDALRLSEPQPVLSVDFARSLYKLNNITMINSPSYVRIHGFFDLLVYHGFSFDYYMNNVDYLRKAGSYDAIDKMMELTLKKRHIAPTHVSGLYIPDSEKDWLIIERVPDIFVTGHIHHEVKISSYKNVTLVGCSSFQSKTAFQEKTGHTNIVTGKVPVINLKNRQIKIMNFACEN